MTTVHADGTDEDRAADQRAGDDTGWHRLGVAEDYRDGKPHAIEAFGTKLVAFAARNGDVQVLDAYCPHLGGDLSYGAVNGDSIDCPIHHWRWDGSGTCIGGTPRPTPIRAWTTLEREGQLFVWHDPQGNSPPFRTAQRRPS